MRNFLTHSEQLFSYLILINTVPISYLCSRKSGKMVTELIIVWALAVVAFFVLWAVLLKVIQRISKRKKGEEDPSDTGSTQVRHRSKTPPTVSR